MRVVCSSGYYLFGASKTLNTYLYVQQRERVHKVLVLHSLIIKMLPSSTTTQGPIQQWVTPLDFTKNRHQGTLLKACIYIPSLFYSVFHAGICSVHTVGTCPLGSRVFFFLSLDFELFHRRLLRAHTHTFSMYFYVTSL